jgi:pimeloyl-ACP methyl ester carboxylesterase
MKLYRRINNSQKLKECSVDEIDFNKRLLIVFPGRDRLGAGLEIANTSTTKDAVLLSSIKLAERMLGLKGSSEKLDIVVAQWEMYENAAQRATQLKENPKFFSDEAEQFMDRLRHTGFNSHNTTLLGWSYGSCFLQECANVAREKHCAIDKVQALAMGTVIAPEELPHAFPGVYVYGTNDKLIEEYNPKAWQRFSSQPDTLSIKDVDAAHTYISAPIPNEIVRWVPDLKIMDDPNAHMVAGYADAYGTSVRKGKDGAETLAGNHVPIVIRCFNNMVGRGETFDKNDLFKNTQRLGQKNPPGSALHPYQDMTSWRIAMSREKGDGIIR